MERYTDDYLGSIMERYTDDYLKAHIERYRAERSDRSQFESVMQEIAEYIIPERANITNAPTPGSKNTSKIFDTTAIDALELWASGMAGLLTNQALYWFNFILDTPELMESQANIEWIEKSVAQMHKAVNNSNFHNEAYECYMDAGSLGTTSLYCAEGASKELHFKAMHVDEFVIFENAEGYVDSLYRLLNLTARQCKQQFGEKLTDEMKKSLKDNEKEKSFEILHCVYPREDDYRTKNKDGEFTDDSNSLPFASIYISIGEQGGKDSILEEGGYHEFPYAVPRTKKMTGEKYGRSPAWNALADIKMVNRMCKTYIRRLEKETDPPLQLPDEGYMLPIRVGPGGVNFYSDPGGTKQNRIEPIQFGGQLQFSEQEIENRRKSIDNKFFKDLWTLMEQPNMTATEVIERIQQKLRIVGPYLARFQPEFLKPIVKRVFGIMLRNGSLSDPPPELKGQLHIVYESPIGDAQKAYQAESANKALAMAAPLLQVNPDVVDNIDVDKMVRFYWTAMRAPTSLLFTEDEVKATREERQAQQAQEKQGQDLMAITQGAKNLKGTALEKAAGDMFGGASGGKIPATGFAS